ncbi:hypothetical protein ACODNH_21240 (plasmid) [Haloarcula sp. NS06]|uniref:hypothetical protein n=1 Tax=Haloarcula sp. NS06 TaxID=3409688 RepID=UPI003DA79EC0
MTEQSRTDELDDLLNKTACSQSPQRPYGSRAQILSRVDEQSALLDVPVAICCPNCGQAVALYEQGLPSVVPHFDTACTQCEVDLRTWCAVGVDAAYLQIVDPATLTTMVQCFWDEWLWSGITNSKDEPRTNEYTERFATKTAAFGWNWEVSCPLCRRTLTELKRDSALVGGNLDYHHWSHDPDQGVCLCRQCHDIIGFDTYDTELEERATAWGFGSRHDLQVIRLALRDAAVTGRPVSIRPVTALVDRYNLVQSSVRVRELLESISTDGTLRERFLDKRLVAGIEADC